VFGLGLATALQRWLWEVFGWQVLVFDSLLARTFFRLKREFHAPQAIIYTKAVSPIVLRRWDNVQERRTPATLSLIYYAWLGGHLTRELNLFKLLSSSKRLFPYSYLEILYEI
jgi:hypothetical protein